ncbi:MAG: SURF1 family cytochrome oxidase biogenesis protein [Rothia sp. (in: high G+C Gram-positive bacteria)]|nr:SURF1 family cytochrome oxidase biogenesis protein [Rothia sp. (in: high G+C Gram-positive bacteria)]
MLKLAFTPRWLGGLFAVLALVTGFVLLSSWQLGASTSGQRTVDATKDRVHPYQQVLQPGGYLDAQEADTVVEARGRYVPGSSYLVERKLKDGQEGYWVVSLFEPTDTDTVKTSFGEGQRGIAVARGWTPVAQIPAEPTGQVTVAGRVVGNDPPVTSNLVKTEGAEIKRVLGSANSSFLTNLWDAPLYNGILTADSETTGSTPVTEEGTIAAEATVIGGDESLQPIRAGQVTDESVNWLNIFYAVEWLVFAGFALYLWWRMLKDATEKEADPALYFEYEGEYWIDEASGKPYYYDPVDDAYYFFDEVEKHQPQAPNQPG